MLRVKSEATKEKDIKWAKVFLFQGSKVVEWPHSWVKASIFPKLFSKINLGL